MADRRLFMTFTNAGYLPYALNLVESARLANVPWEILVIALDTLAFQELQKRNIQCALWGGAASIPETFIHYRNSNFNPICFAKLDVISWCLNKYGGDIDTLIYLDSDIWIKKDFSTELDKYKEYDIVFQCDEGHSKACQKPCENLCAGFMMLRNNDIVKRLLSYKDPEKYLHDQDYINKVIKQYDIRYTTFERKVFPNGVFVNNIPNDAAMIHYNYIEGHEKMEKMKTNGHWRKQRITEQRVRT